MISFHIQSAGSKNHTQEQAQSIMEILGIGVPELLFIILLILILLGPKDMVSAGKTLGGWLNKMVHSPTYKLLTKTGEELKNLPRNLMRDANIEEFQKEVQGIGKQVSESTNSIGSSLSRSFDEKQIFLPTPGEKKQPGSETPSAPPTDPNAAEQNTDSPSEQPKSAE